jgi:hypothetical protein
MLSTQYVPGNASTSTARRQRRELFAETMTHDELSSALLALSNTSASARARCTAEMQQAPLPCASGALPGQCIDGLRHCSNADTYDAAAYENSLEPRLVLDMDAPSVLRQQYVWAVEIDLPSDHRAARLWRSLAPGGGYGYRLRLLQSNGEETKVECLPLEAQRFTGHQRGITTQQHLCAHPTATDPELYELAQARFVELTLLGAFRQIFVHAVRIVERELPNAMPHPPPLPSPPPAPGHPPEPPGAPAPDLGAMGCAWRPGVRWTSEVVEKVQEPCLWSPEKCCAETQHMLTHWSSEVNAFELSASGCCTLLWVSDRNATESIDVSMTLGGGVGYVI